MLSGTILGGFVGVECGLLALWLSSRNYFNSMLPENNGITSELALAKQSFFQPASPAASTEKSRLIDNESLSPDQ